MKRATSLTPVLFWAVVFCGCALLWSDDFGLPLQDGFLAFSLLYVVAIATIFLCNKVFLERASAIGGARATVYWLSVAYTVITVGVPLFGVWFAATTSLRPDVSGGVYVITLGLTPFLVSAMVTYYACVEKIVEEANWSPGEAGSAKASHRTLLSPIADLIRLCFGRITILISILTIGRKATDDKLVETSDSGVFGLVGLTCAFYGFVFLYAWAFPIQAFANHDASRYRGDSEEIGLFALDNFLKAIAGDFPELAGLSLTDLSHNTSDLLITTVIGVFRLMIPLAVLLILVGRPARTVNRS